MTVLRSLLFVPGNQPRMLEKALGLRPDAVVPDMEDSVPMREKSNARSVTASFLPRLAGRGALVVPRVNSLDTELLEGDLAAVVGPHIFGVSVGKIRTADDTRHIASVIEDLERQEGLEVGAIKLIPWIETARAVVDAYNVCTASPRVVAVAFGAEDFTNDMAIERSEDDSEVAYARSAVCVAARAADVLALDTPYFSFRDAEGLRQNAALSRRYGFKGKFAIHPGQVEVINEVFSPSPQEVEHARRVVAAFEETERAGRGSTSLDGKVIDVPVVRRARQVLELAAAMQQGR